MLRLRWVLLVLMLGVGVGYAQDERTYDTAELAAGEIVLQYPTGWEVRYQESDDLRLVQISNWEAWLLASQSNSPVQQQPGPGEFVITLWMLPQDQLVASLSSGVPEDDLLLAIADQFAAQLFEGANPLGAFQRVGSAGGDDLALVSGVLDTNAAALGVRQQGRAVIAGLAVAGNEAEADARGLVSRIVPSVQLNAPMTGETTAPSGYQEAAETGPDIGPDSVTTETTADAPRAGDFFAQGLGRDADNPIMQNADWQPVIETVEGVPMALVPTGCFTMGADDGAFDEAPTHEQCFAQPFWIDVTEVSRAMYDECVQAEACRAQRPIPTANTPDQPITNLTWYEASAYCAWRGARLPTEPEWEYAARGPDSQRYPWGGEFQRDYVAAASTVPVGETEGNVSWAGVRDMIGNVQEWVGSSYAGYPYHPDDGREDPSTSDARVLRGGSWQHDADILRTTTRRWLYPYGVSLGGGVRCALPY